MCYTIVIPLRFLLINRKVKENAYFCTFVLSASNYTEIHNIYKLRKNLLLYYDYYNTQQNYNIFIII